MNFTESFDQFASKTTPTDLALYAGIGVVLFVLFKDRLSPVQQILLSVYNKVQDLFGGLKKTGVTKPVVAISNNKDSFYDLIVSWKRTRDLAIEHKCTEAVKVIDQMFPYLNPGICEKDESL